MISQQRLANGRTVENGPPKTRASRRTLALDRTTVALLRKRLQRRQADQLAAGHRQESGHVFTAADGQPLHPDWITRRFGHLVKDSALPPVRLHDLRHGAATLAHEAGRRYRAKIGQSRSAARDKGNGPEPVRPNESRKSKRTRKGRAPVTHTRHIQTKAV
jgi:integrase